MEVEHRFVAPSPLNSFARKVITQQKEMLRTSWGERVGVRGMLDADSATLQIQ